jgi:hypothetical protein
VPVPGGEFPALTAGQPVFIADCAHMPVAGIVGNGPKPMRQRKLNLSRWRCF